MTGRAISIGDFLSPAEFRRAVKLYKETCHNGGFAKRCAAEIIEPILPRINEALGQKTDAKTLAAAVEDAVMRGGI